MFFSMWEIEKFFQAIYFFFFYRLVCKGIFGMVPESVDGVLNQYHVSRENNTMGPRQHGTH